MALSCFSKIYLLIMFKFKNIDELLKHLEKVEKEAAERRDDQHKLLEEANFRLKL